MARLGGSDEVVVRNLERLPQIAKRRLHGVAPRLRRIEAVLLGRLRHLLAMLVHAGEELDVVPARATEARLHIGENRAVRRTEMRLGVHVVDGRRDVIRGLRVLHGDELLQWLMHTICHFSACAARAPSAVRIRVQS